MKDPTSPLIDQTKPKKPLYLPYPRNTKFILANAYEIIADDIGNEDGLCDSDESCIYAPHMGAFTPAYPDLMESCIFQNGTISNVTLYR